MSRNEVEFGGNLLVTTHNVDAFIKLKRGLCKVWTTTLHIYLEF